MRIKGVDGSISYGIPAPAGTNDIWTANRTNRYHAALQKSKFANIEIFFCD